MSSSLSRHETRDPTEPPGFSAQQPPPAGDEAGDAAEEDARPAHHDDDEDDDDDDDGELPTRGPIAHEAELPSPFQPFFTLIEDATTRQHHHPKVHYVFADDDPDMVTRAALATLSSAPAGDGEEQEEAEERYIVVDLAADGKTVVSATSLSREWQNVATKVAHAPSWGADEGGRGTGNRGRMLCISGQEVGSGKERERRQDGAEVQELVKAFAERLDELNGVLGAATNTNITPAQTGTAAAEENL